VPLYPGGATTRLPRDRIAQVSGPIGGIDGQDVSNQGGFFDLLPGCHIVELDNRAPSSNFALASGFYWSGRFPSAVYAIHMKPGAVYVIHRDLHRDGSGTSRIVLSAREEQANGVITELTPARSQEELQACNPALASRPGLPAQGEQRVTGGDSGSR
jgi:hypothetical protein